MIDIERSYEWESAASDPNDETFGDVIESIPSADGLSEFGAVLLGEPYDGAVIGRKGAHAGPAAIRDELAGVKSHHFEQGPVGLIGDLGDLAIPRNSTVQQVQEYVATATDRLYDTSAFPVFVGGDNSLTVPNVSPLLERGSVGVVSLDAHLDCRATDEGVSSGTPYRQLHDRGLASLAVVGARHFETSTVYEEYLREQDGTIVTADAVGRHPGKAVDRALTGIGDVEYLYVSLDLDVLDGALAPGVSAPTPGGLTSREVFELLGELLSDRRVAGFEVVECAPPLDRGNHTVRIASRAIANALSAVVSRRNRAYDRMEGNGGGSND